jgi:hypothetical protein
MIRLVSNVLLFIIFATCAAATLLGAAAGDLEQARGLYAKTSYQEVVRMLETPQEARAEAFDLIGRSLI